MLQNRADQFLSDRLLGVPSGESSETTAIKLILGHELIADGTPYSGASGAIDTSVPFSDEPGGFRKQYQAAADPALETFFRGAVDADRAADAAALSGDLLAQADHLFERNNYLNWSIFAKGGNGSYDPNNPSTWGAGNSPQDLLLSLKGYRFGKEIANGTISSRQAAADWLRYQLAER